MKTLKGKTAILTGGSTGLGVTLARALADAGVNLALAARSADKLQAVAEDMRALGVQAIAIPTDVSQAADREQLVTRTEAELGPVDILINNAGVEQIVTFASQAPDNIARTIEVNLTAAMLLARLVLPGMIARRQGHIVNMASLSGKVALPYAAAYSASKAGMIEWTHAMNSELDGSGVNVSAICPGFVSAAGMFARFERRSPLLMGTSTPEQVARSTLRAIRRNRVEAIVNPIPMQGTIILKTLLPNAIRPLLRWIGLIKLQRKIVSEYEGEQKWNT